MKVTIKQMPKQAHDWNKASVVTDGETYIRTSGKHSEDIFEGQDIKTGEISDHWRKEPFNPIPSPITITIEP